jgi:histidinol-phosphatase
VSASPDAPRLLRDQSGGFGAAWSAGLRAVPEAELEAWLALALAVCDEADPIARSVFRRDVEVRTKPDRTFVTQADTAVERAIRSRILAAFPDHGLVGEEYGTEAGDARTRWYIDPIDGTHNFIRGVPVFGTLLAVEHDGELQAGVISAPALHERWWASRGGGAWARSLDDAAPRRIAVSAVGSLDDAQVLYGAAAEVDRSGEAPGFRELLRSVWRERGLGDFWGYALLAEGAAEAMVEVDLSAWDSAAPFVLVEEAGGRVTDFGGRRALDSGTFLATNGIVHDEVRRRLLETPPA